MIPPPKASLLQKLKADGWANVSEGQPIRLTDGTELRATFTTSDETATVHWMLTSDDDGEFFGMSPLGKARHLLPDLDAVLYVETDACDGRWIEHDIVPLSGIPADEIEPMREAWYGLKYRQGRDTDDWEFRDWALDVIRSMAGKLAASRAMS